MQPCERPPPGIVTLNYSVEYLPTNTYLPSPEIKREGGLRKTRQKMASRQQGYSEDTCVNIPRGASAKGIAPRPPPSQRSWENC